jgi:glutamate-1-semialdehyde 2,1-aminomutase
MNTGGFHGSVDYFMTGNAEAGGRHGEYPGIDRAISDKTLAVAFNDVAALDSLFGAHGARIAAFIVEPVLRGALPPRPGYLEALRRHCDDSGALLIFDEVVTGFRLGPGGAQSYFGVTPDITAYGKIIGGGFPIGAVAGRREIMRYLSPSTPPADRVYLASTWLGFPISLAAGCASLDVLGEPGAYDHLFDLGDYFRHRFNRLFEEIGLPGQALGVGPIFNVFLTDARVEDWASSQPSYRPEGVQQLKRRLLEVGLNMQGPSYLPGFGKYLCVAHTHELIDEAADLFRQAIEDVDLGSYRLQG